MGTPLLFCQRYKSARSPIGNRPAIMPHFSPRREGATEGYSEVHEACRHHCATALAGQRVAERVGFEPTVRFPAHTLSKRAP
jgi:hypothetical protein